jgi:hypothetical protein
MTICSYNFSLFDVFFFLMNNTSLLNIIMFFFRYCYTFISFRYYLLRIINFNKLINKKLKALYELKQMNQTIQNIIFFLS